MTRKISIKEAISKLDLSEKTKSRAAKLNKATVTRKKKQRITFNLDLSVKERLDTLKIDPVLGLAMFAAGDVVGLGYMTQAEYDAPRRKIKVRMIDKRTNGEYFVLREIASGRELAMDFVTPGMRLSANTELVQYIEPKLKSMEIKDDGGVLKPQVIFMLPDNGRDPKTVVIEHNPAALIEAMTEADEDDTPIETEPEPPVEDAT